MMQQTTFHNNHKLELGLSTNALLKQIAQLQKNIDNLTSRNFQTLSKITQIQYQFQYTLYQAKKIPGKQIIFKKELLLNQLDKLQQEKAFLDKKLHFFNIQQQQKSQYKNNCLLRQSNQYIFLKTIWTKFLSSSSDNALDKIEQLNKAICIFKNNIVNITNIQKIKPSMPQIVKPTQRQFSRLKQKYERANMMIEDLSGIILNKNQLISQIKLKYQLQKYQNEKLKSQHKKYKNSIIKFRMDMVKLDENNFRLSNQIKQLKRYITKLQQQKQKSLQDTTVKNYQISQQKIPICLRQNQKRQIIFFNSFQDLTINLKTKQTVQNKKIFHQIKTIKTFKQITQFLQEKNYQDIQASNQILKIPFLSFLDKEKVSTNYQLSETTLKDNFISKTQSSTSSGSKTQRKLLTTRNQTIDNKDYPKNDLSRIKKFSKTPLNGCNSKNQTQKEEINGLQNLQNKNKQQQANLQDIFKEEIKLNINSLAYQ